MNSKFKPPIGLRYDGIYRIEMCWRFMLDEVFFSALTIYHTFFDLIYTGMAKFISAHHCDVVLCAELCQLNKDASSVVWLI